MNPSSTALLLAASLALSACQTTPPAQPDRFATADTNKDGKLTRIEVSDYEITNVFTGVDANKDGKVTRSEWNPRGDARDELLFVKRDTNKDGVVTLEEALIYARSAGSYDKVFNDGDTNKDNSISREEALAYYAKAEGPAR